MSVLSRIGFIDVADLLINTQQSAFCALYGVCVVYDC